MTKHGEGVGFVDPSAKKEGKCNALRGLCTFIYNPRTKLVMGRNCKEWGQLFIFYVILYAGLIGFWVACLYGFLSTTNTSQPSLLGFQSMLQLNPAMGYRPQPDFESNLIKFNASVPATYQAYLKDVNDYLQPYFNDSVQNQLLDCETPGARVNKTGCQFRPNLKAPACFPEASGPFNFNFPSGKPCIMLKMNRIIGWMPNYVNGSYQDIKVRCTGENPADTENLGTIEYMPGGKDENGTYGVIEAKYLPFLNQPTYLSPLIFAYFKNIQPYTVALVWCQFDSQPMTFNPEIPFWASPLPTERAGGVHFEIVVDKAPGPTVLTPIVAQTAVPKAINTTRA